MVFWLRNNCKYLQETRGPYRKLAMSCCIIDSKMVKLTKADKYKRFSWCHVRHKIVFSLTLKLRGHLKNCGKSNSQELLKLEGTLKTNGTKQMVQFRRMFFSSGFSQCSTRSGSFFKKKSCVFRNEDSFPFTKA